MRSWTVSKGYAPRQACNRIEKENAMRVAVSKGYAPRQACNDNGDYEGAGPLVSKGYAPRQACNSGARKPLAHKGSRRPPR
jgi:hypothetical protein